MPQTKHNLKTVKLRVSYFEQALLDWLTEVDGRTVSDHLRQALKYYVKRSPLSDHSKAAIEDHLKTGQRGPTIQDVDERRDNGVPSVDEQRFERRKKTTDSGAWKPWVVASAH